MTNFQTLEAAQKAFNATLRYIQTSQLTDVYSTETGYDATHTRLFNQASRLRDKAEALVLNAGLDWETMVAHIADSQWQLITDAKVEGA